MSAPTGPAAIIFGATGAVGKPLVSELLASPHYSQVHAFVRRPFKDKSPHKDRSKLVEHVIDFEKVWKAGTEEGGEGEDSEDVKKIRGVGAEAVYITLGTTRAQAGSAEAFVKIDREYVLAAAKAALDGSKKEKQKVLYVSAPFVSSKSKLLYLQSKGMTEEGLAALGYSDCILFRPMYLASPQREQKRIVEEVFGFFMTNVAGRFSNSVEIKVADLAKAMLLAGVKGSSGITSMGAGSPPNESFQRPKDSTVTLISNAEARRLSQVQ